MRIKSYIQEVAKTRGIENANQLREALKISPTIAARLWKGDFDKIGLVTLERLCEALRCQPGKLLKYEPGEK